MTRLLLALSLIAVACAPPGPIVVEGTPADLAEVIDATLAAVEGTVPAHASCLQGLTVDHAWELEHRATYDPETGTIVLRVPATAAHLEFSLVHEIGHHLEFACPVQVGLRRPFLEAQGLPVDSEWFDGPSWEETPSEQFATALAQRVTGRPEPLRRVRVTEEALALVEAWAVGGVTHVTSAP